MVNLILHISRAKAHFIVFNNLSKILLMLETPGKPQSEKNLFKSSVSVLCHSHENM